MKKLLLASALFLFALFVSPKDTFAQSCTCSIGTNRVPYVSSPCPTGYVSSCTGNPYQGQLGCNCAQENPGMNCARQNEISQTGKPCCSGLTPSQGGVCIPSNVNPYTGQVNAAKADPTTGCSGQSINTALGCIPVGNTDAFVVWLLRWGMGIGGGIAFVLIIIASFQIMTSAGDPARLKAGQELLTSAIAGLIMLIFSVFILKVIGVDILKLPGLS